MAGGDAPLGLQLLQGLVKGQHHVGGGGEAPLAAAVLHPLPLVIEVQGQGAGLAGAGGQLLPVGQDEGEAGNPLDALVGAGDQEVDPPVGQGDVDAAEGGHGVHDKGLAGGLGHLAHRGHVVENAAGGLPVDHGHVGDGGVLRQILGHRIGLGALVVGLLIEGVGHPGVAADVGHPQAIGPVGGDEDLVLRPHHGGEDGLHPEGAAALHQHGGVRRLGHMAQGQQLGADALGDLLVIVVPGAVVHLHHGLHRVGGGEGTGGQKLILVHNTTSFSNFFHFSGVFPGFCP